MFAQSTCLWRRLCSQGGTFLISVAAGSTHSSTGGTFFKRMCRFEGFCYLRLLVDLSPDSRVLASSDISGSA